MLKPGIALIVELDPVAERVADVATIDRESGVILLDRHTSADEDLTCAGQVADDQRGVRLRVGPEAGLRRHVDRSIGTDEPAAAATGELRWLGDLPEPEDPDVEGPCHILAAGRHRELDVIDADHLDHVLGFFAFGVFGFGTFAFGGSSVVGAVDSVAFVFAALGVGRRARDPAVAALHASMS